MTTMHPNASSSSHVRTPVRRVVYTSRNWVRAEAAELDRVAETLCGGDATDRDLVLSDVLRAGKLIRGGTDLDEWVGCATCRQLVRDQVD